MARNVTDLHLVWSRSAAASLRGALRQRRNVVRADQAPDLGPLDDGTRRGEFFRDLWASVGHSPQEFGDDYLPADAFSEWRAVLQTIVDVAPGRVLIWTSASGADHVFLRMATHFLREQATPLWQVRVDTGDAFCGVASVSGERLLTFLPSATRIQPETASKYNEEFRIIAENPYPLRMAGPDGKLTFHEMSFYDDAILNRCSWEWRFAVHVVGDTMGHADHLNPPSDVLIFSRLRHLARAKRLEFDGPVKSIYEDGFRRRLVRLPTP